MHVTFSGVTKAFDGMMAVEDASFVIGSGSVHALVGENGAGKSTLGKMLAGLYQPSSGTISIDDKPASFSSPREALSRGIAIVQQELALVPSLTIAQNVLLGLEDTRLSWISDRALLRRFDALANRSGFELDGRRLVSSLSLAQRQQVEILKAVAREAKLIIFDEPTSSLTPVEVDRLHALIAKLNRERGTTIVYVSHFLDHVMTVCSHVTVMRNGCHIRTSSISEESQTSLVTAMLGRSLQNLYPPKIEAPRPPLKLTFRALGIAHRSSFHDVSFDIAEGQIIGITGLVGSGCSEVGQVIFGAETADAGTMQLLGRPHHPAAPLEAMAAGVGLVPESRRDQGLLMGDSIAENLALVNFRDLRTLGWLRRGAESKVTGRLVGKYGIKARNAQTVVSGLSGGNQQKVLFAKWVERNPKLLILDGPTRGVDVGAKAEIYRLIAELAQAGTSILVISPEIEEVVGLCSKVIVMRQGNVVAQFENDDISVTSILNASLGVAGNNEGRRDVH